MIRPTFEVADILRVQGDRFLDRYRSSFGFQQLKAFRAILRCRTAALGGHRDACPSCGHQAISYNSCRNRHCPKCQTQARERWLAARERELLTTSYFHVVFTVPHELNVLALENPRLFYDLLFTASAQTLLEIAIDRKHLGAEIGVIGILHTWGQNLLLHPHIHCVIPAGGLSPDHRRWIRPRYPFFLPVKVLSRVFRGKFLAGLKRLHHRHQLCCAGPTVALADPQQFAKLMRPLHRHDWVVYAKPAFGGPLQVLRYLGRYTHRVAISNHRLLAFDQGLVTFRWKDYAHGGKQGKMTLLATAVLRRLFRHADALVCLPHRDTLPRPAARSPRLAPAIPSTITRPPFQFASSLPVFDSATNCRSNPIAHRVRRKRQRLPPSLLIENASDRDSARPQSLPEAFPIKASDHSSRRPVRLLQPDSPSDQQFLTGDPAGIFGRQEESSFCNIFRRAHASQRSAGNCQLLKTVPVLWQRKHTLGLCCAGRKRIDTDFPRCKFQGQRARNHIYRSFGGAVHRAVDDRRFGRDGAHINDASALAIHVCHSFFGRQQ